MNAIERSILREPIRAVIRHNPHEWWELKWQIWDWGNQLGYPALEEFRFPVKGAVARLSMTDRELLRAVHVGRSNAYLLPDDETLNRYYIAVMLEEIVRRAGIAAYRTVNW